MALNIQQLVLLGLLTTSVHWLVARSKIAKPLWSRARGWLAVLLECPACSGWWLGLAAGALGVQPVGHGIVGVVLAGLLAIVVTPIFEGVMVWGLAASAVGNVTDEDAQDMPRPNDHTLGT